MGPAQGSCALLHIPRVGHYLGALSILELPGPMRRTAGQGRLSSEGRAGSPCSMS